jgi:hypothetical protein
MKVIDNVSQDGDDRRKIRLIEGNAKCPQLKKLTCKGTLRQVFIRVYRFSHVGIFVHFGICTLLCCPSPLLSGSTFPHPPLPCINKYTARIQWVRMVGMGFWASVLIITCRKVPLQVNILDDDILLCYSSWGGRTMEKLTNGREENYEECFSMHLYN